VTSIKREVIRQTGILIDFRGREGLESPQKLSKVNQ